MRCQTAGNRLNLPAVAVQGMCISRTKTTTYDADCAEQLLACAFGIGLASTVVRNQGTEQRQKENWAGTERRPSSKGERRKDVMKSVRKNLIAVVWIAMSLASGGLLAVAHL